MNYIKSLLLLAIISIVVYLSINNAILKLTDQLYNTKTLLAQSESKITELEKQLNTFNSPLPTTCYTGKVAITTEVSGVFFIGEQQICGYNLTWSNVYGPDFQAYIDSLERENKELQNKAK